MVDLDMQGLYALNNNEVRRRVEANRKGNYAFCAYKDDGLLYIFYVGRSDADLQAEIIARSADFPQLTHFMFSYALSAKAAYEKECKNYHDCGGSINLLNKIHPDRPNGASYHCPVCGHPIPNYTDIFKPLTYLK